MSYYREQLVHLRLQLGAMMDEIIFNGNIVKVTLKEESIGRCGYKTARTHLRERDAWADFYRNHLISWQNDYCKFISPSIAEKGDEIFQDISVFDGQVTITMRKQMLDMALEQETSDSGCEMSPVSYVCDESLSVLLNKLWNLCYIRIHRTLLGAYAYHDSRLIQHHAVGVIGAVLEPNDERLQRAGYRFPKYLPKIHCWDDDTEFTMKSLQSVQEITRNYTETLVHLMHQLDAMMNEIVIEGKVVKVTLKGVILDKKGYDVASPESSEKATWAKFYKRNLLFLKENMPKYVDDVIEDVAICDGEVAITLTERMKNMNFLLDNLWSLCYIRIHCSLLCAYVHHKKQPNDDQALGVIGSVQQLLEEFKESHMLTQVSSTEHTGILRDINLLDDSEHWNFLGLQFLAQLDSGSENNKLDILQKLSKMNMRHASIQVSVDATDAETQSDLQFCEISYDIKLTTESDFVICGLKTEFPLAVYIPRDTISTQDEAVMTVTITCNMTQQQCNSEDDDVQDIGPTLTFTPHRYNFLRPILVFMYLPDRYQTKQKDHEYAVLYSNTDRDEKPIWEDVTGFDHYPVSGVVIPCSNLAILRFTHFCSSKVVVQPSEKACVANVFAFVDHACPGVCITCLLCPERHKGARRYEERSAIIKGSLEKSKVFCVSNANSPVSLEVTQSHPSWQIEHEEDKKQLVAHSLVWKGKYPDSEFVFIPVRGADCLPPIFRCRLELKHESHTTITNVTIPTQEKFEASDDATAKYEPSMSSEQHTNEPKSLSSIVKNQSPSQLVLK